MKIKHDFITNSSTSCYVIFGIRFDNKLENIPLKLRLEYFEKYPHDDKETEENLISDILDLKSNDFSIFNHSDWNYSVIGFSPTDIEDNETMFQFKQRLIDSLKEIGFENIYISDIIYFQEAIADY